MLIVTQFVGVYVWNVSLTSNINELSEEQITEVTHILSHDKDIASIVFNEQYVKYLLYQHTSHLNFAQVKINFPSNFSISNSTILEEFVGISRGVFSIF